ncbi:MAG TPA: low molecular weight phosphatase family protein [Actinomycetota bacterium]|nr:low molecular weight phosphatase family protein [Actinomycetota bacterium]
MARVLVVCTGNVCRSPIAEGMLRAAFVERLGDEAPDVVSAGTMGWEGSGADPSSIAAAAERGVDISGHVARALSTVDVRSADLVLAMSSEHANAVVRGEPEAAPRTFTLKELVRLLEALPDPTGQDLRSRVGAAHAVRTEGFDGNPHDLDVADPLGMPLQSFRAVAWELEAWCGRLADGLVGRAPARALPGPEVE